MAPLQSNDLRNRTGMSQTDDSSILDLMFIGLVTGQYTLWIVLALYFMISCYICERGIRLKCKIWKRMGYRCKSIRENPLNCIWIFFHCYFAQLCWWDGNKAKEYIHTLRSPVTNKI